MTPLGLLRSALPHAIFKSNQNYLLINDNNKMMNVFFGEPLTEYLRKIFGQF